MSLPWRDGCGVIAEGLKQSAEDRLYMMYCSVYPFMDSSSFVTFEQFKGSIDKPEVENLSYSDIVTKTNNMFFNHRKEE